MAGKLQQLSRLSAGIDPMLAGALKGVSNDWRTSQLSNMALENSGSPKKALASNLNSSCSGGIPSLWGNICPLQGIQQIPVGRKKGEEAGVWRVKGNQSLLYLLNKYSFCVLRWNTNLGWRHRKPPNLSSFIQPSLLSTLANIHSQRRKVASAVF